MLVLGKIQVVEVEEEPDRLVVEVIREQMEVIRRHDSPSNPQTSQEWAKKQHLSAVEMEHGVRCLHLGWRIDPTQGEQRGKSLP